jgi:FkbM family methyltransferase
MDVHAAGDQHISTTLARTGKWEPFTTRILAALVRPGDVVVDVGANIGWYSAVLGRLVGAGGTVIAVEPDPRNLELLRRNMAGVAARYLEFAGALADRESTMELSLSPSNLGDHRLVGSTAHPEEQLRTTVTVPVATLDALFAVHSIDPSEVRVLKIDTQGAESLIFLGSPQFFGRFPSHCAAIIEFAPNLLRQHGDDQIKTFIETVTGFGRTLYRVRRSSLVPTSAADLEYLAAKLRPLGDEWAVDVLVVPDDPSGKRLARFRVPRPVRWA